jgi:hypothetical protein
MELQLEREVVIITKERTGCLEFLQLAILSTKWSEFSFHNIDPIVMITIFCDFCQFSAKNWRFSQKPMLRSQFLQN